MAYLMTKPPLKKDKRGTIKTISGEKDTKNTRQCNFTQYQKIIPKVILQVENSLK